DSIALLHLLIRIAPRHTLKLGIAHLNHNLRGAMSDNDAAFVSSHAQSVGLKCYCRKEDICMYQRRHNLSLEHAARRVRYRFLIRTAQEEGFNKIALAHHCDDNAELILMNLLRGSGPLGLSGIPPVRNAAGPAIKIVRPLIDVSKKEILDYLDEAHLPYITDSSNADTQYLRNRIRHDLIPYLQASYNPSVTQTLNQLANITRTEEEWISSLITPFFKKTVIAQSHNSVTFSVLKLRACHPAAIRRIIRRAIHEIKGDFKRITFTHIALVMQILKHGPVIGSIDLPDRIRVRRNNDKLVLSQKKTGLRNLKPSTANIKKPVYRYQISKPEKWKLSCFAITIKEIDVRLQFSHFAINRRNFRIHPNPDIACLDLDALCFPLTLRNWKNGDRFRPLGMTGSQKLAKFFNSNKIELSQRINCPVLLSGNEIAWVAGHRMADSFKITSSTQKVLKIELLLAY
ncbi:tRNA lysidine(34) synthetase TilS, partial [Desulfococcaceae bacterium HSG7]|nr:tRNA lysidine(34) synthetase TilS [Desulfococcaceae bacterium HSG7]